MIQTDTTDTLELKTEQAFHREFLEKPSLQIFSPGRINLIGEHTDYNQGFVLPASINLGIAVAIKPSNDDRCSVFASDKNEYLYFNTEDDLKPIEKGGWKNYILGVVIELKKKGINVPNFNLVFSGNVPRGSGLSSSAALENGVVFALNELFNLCLSKYEMILISQSAEHNSVGVHCGIMDQYISMLGKENQAIFLDCQTNTSEYVGINLVNHEILLINSNVKHNLSEDSYNDRRNTCEKVAQLLGKISLREITMTMLDEISSKITNEEYQMCLYVLQENQRVIQAITALESGDVENLGSLLFESHKGLKDQYQVSCPELDFLVNEAKNHPNVIGSRMMGGGFGGCTLNIIQSGKTESFLKEITQKYATTFEKDCIPIQVNISEGTRIIR